MKRVIFAIMSLVFMNLTASGQTSLKIVSLKRKFSGNGEWTIATSKGSLSLKSIFTNGSEWKVTGLGKTEYVIKQTSEGDPSEWRITDGINEMFFTLSFSKNFNEWRTGEEGKFVYVKTVFNNDYTEWKAEGNTGELTIKRRFTDGSEWTIDDKLLNESDMTKLTIVFIPVAMLLR